MEQQNWRLNNLKKSQLTVRFIIAVGHRPIDRTNERTTALRYVLALALALVVILFLFLFIAVAIIIMIIIAMYTVYSSE